MLPVGELRHDESLGIQRDHWLGSKRSRAGATVRYPNNVISGIRATLGHPTRAHPYSSYGSKISVMTPLSISIQKPRAAII